MTPDEMLDAVSDYGEDALSDYNDGLDGWFGWRVSSRSDTLVVTWRKANEDGSAGPAEVQTWRLERMS